jgi:hypothetical protein
MRNYHAEARAAIDLAAPYITTGTPDLTTQEQIQPPPSESDLNQRVAEILVAGGTVAAIALAIHALIPDLGIEVPAIVAALNFTAGRKGNPHIVRANYAAEGVHGFSSGGKVMRAAANEELYYRAAYIINAARRIQKSINNGMKIKDALAAERSNYELHTQARAARQAAAGRVALAASLFGDTLGWYINPLLNNERACIAANGHNFRADTIPHIGWPGMVHPKCGCKPGPPIEGAGSVDDATDGAFKRVNAPKVLALHRQLQRRAS